LLLALALTASAEASSIKLQAGSTEVIVEDGTAADINSVDGAVTYSGAIGDWIINVTTGTTQPAIGTLTDPEMSFTDVSVLSAGSSTLTLMYSALGFTTTGGLLEVNFGGTTSGDVTYKVFQGGASLFDTTSQPVPLTSLAGTTGSFAGSQSVFLPAAGPYSLTQQVTIGHSKPGVTSYSATVSYSAVPDGGATLSLLGLALVGVAGLRTRLR
jgi:hypothetical protein